YTDFGFVLDRHYVDPPLSRARLSPLFLFPPQLTLDLNSHPVRLSHALGFSFSYAFIRFPHAPASPPTSFALLLPTHVFASSRIRIGCSTEFIIANRLSTASPGQPPQRGASTRDSRIDNHTLQLPRSPTPSDTHRFF
ncbi:hypothetical protein N7530_004699, partial [Penicillium desertorum]